VAGQCKNDCPGTNGDRHCHREPMKNQIVWTQINYSSQIKGNLGLLEFYTLSKK
jgi:hypothetical protein